MILYANGCSMTYGTELGGETIDNGLITDNDPIFRKQHAYPAVLSKLLNKKECFNDGIGGGSNDRIFRTTMEWTSNYLQHNDGKDLFVVIGWSVPERTEYNIKNRWVTVLPHCSPIHDFQNIIKIHKFHVEHLMDERKDYTASINYMLALQSWFQINLIPFLFFNALHVYWPKIKEIDILRKHINQNRYYRFDDKDFCMFTFCQNYPCGPRQHPLEDGHRQWANTLYRYIIDNKLNETD